MAEEKELAHSRRRREQQQISIPYLWEEKPGLLKKGWTSQFAAVTTPPVASPSRLVVSVPYLWEEKPGKPIQTTQSIPDMLASPHQLELALLPDQYHYLNPFADEQNHPLNPFLDPAEETTDWQSKADHSFAALPDGWESFSESGSYWNENCWHSASETDGRSSSSSSAAAAEDDRKDTSVMEFLFPLYSSPSLSFLVDSVKDEEAPSPVAQLTHCESTAITGRTLTLGELILLSRKLSYKRKQVNIRKTNHKEYLKKSVLTCIPFMYHSNKGGAYISN